MAELVALALGVLGGGVKLLPSQKQWPPWVQGPGGCPPPRPFLRHSVGDRSRPRIPYCIYYTFYTLSLTLKTTLQAKV